MFGSRAMFERALAEKACLRFATSPLSGLRKLALRHAPYQMMADVSKKYVEFGVRIVQQRGDELTG